MIKRLVAILFYLGIAFVITCLVAPSFIDWNQHKDKIIGQISPYIKRKVEVAGNVSFHVLPQPQIVLESVKIADLATLKLLEVRVRLSPLLEGRIEIENINMVEPVLNLEVMADGKTNWTDVIAVSGKTALAPTAVSLKQATISSGILNYKNLVTGSERKIDNLNLSITADTLAGPYRVVGNILFKGIRVNIDASTGDFDRASLSAPLQLSFMPAQSLPQVKLNGVIALKSGLDVQGEVSIKTGTLSSLASDDVLRTLGFMQQNADLTCVMEFRDDQLTVNDLKAKFGKASTLHGKASIQFVRGGSPLVTMELEGDGLSVTEKPVDAYIDVPAGYDGNLKFKGKNIIWAGRKLNALDISVSPDATGWNIKSAQISLPGKTQVMLAGNITPKTDSARFPNLQLTTDDTGKLIGFLGAGDNSIFKALAGIGKMSLTASLSLTPQGIGFSNLNATMNDKSQATGTFVVDRIMQTPNFSAKLHLSDWDDSKTGLFQAIRKSTADMELTANNFTYNGLLMTDVALKAKADGQGVSILEMSGALPDGGNITLKGRVAGDFDLAYTLKTAHVEHAAKALNISLPPQILTLKNLNVQGGIKTEGEKYRFTADGSAESLELQGQLISQPIFKIEGDADSVKVNGLEGAAWGGKLKADMAFSRTDRNVTFKGILQQADLQKLQELTGFTGFSTGTGDVNFDLSANSSNTSPTIVGNADLKISTLTVENFSFGKLGITIDQLPEPPSNLSSVVNDALHKNGSTTFKNVEGGLKIDQGKISFENIKLSDAGGAFSLSGTANALEGSYDLSGELRLNKPKDFPAFKLHCIAGKDGCKTDTAPLKEFIIRNNPPPPVVTPLPPVAAPGELPTVIIPAPEPPKDPGTIKDILKRLDEEEAPPQELSPVPEPAPALPPDAPLVEPPY